MIATLQHISKFYGKNRSICALRDVTFSVVKGKRLMITGASGSGKSTLAKVLAGWEQPDEGVIEFSGTRPQLIPQEPATSLNPYWTALEIVAEPYRIGGMQNAAKLAVEWIDRVELPPSCASKLSSRFSGGEQARLAIARAMAALTIEGREAGLLMFDESFSALDEPLRIRLLEFLIRLQTTFPVTYAFVSHDLGLTSGFMDSIAVMENGLIVEYGDAPQMLNAPTSQTMIRLVAASRGVA